MSVKHWLGILSEAIGDRAVVLVGGALRRELADVARAVGARWVGALGEDAGTVGADVSAAFTDDWRGVLDAVDRDLKALVVGHNFHPHRTLGSRRFVGRRRPEWRPFEDKPAMWERLVATGFDLGPFRIVAARTAELKVAARELDAGAGTVWAGDHRDGERSGGSHIRIVTTPTQADAGVAHFAATSERVRVMPLLAGTPCSIHCLVSADEVVPLQPARLDVDRDDLAGTFNYLSADWTWEPSERLVASAQRFARCAGALMRDDAGYRGVFCVDGVAVDDVFHPTEVNSRWGASLTTLASQHPTLGLRFVHAFLADGLDADWSLNRLAAELAPCLPGVALGEGHS